MRVFSMLEKFPFPAEVEWSLDWSCNVSCFFCSTAKHPRHPPAELERIADAILECRPFTVTLSGGEPLSVASSPNLIKKFIRGGIPPSITTNGMFLHHDCISPDLVRGCNWFRVSLHSVIEDTSKRIFGSRYSLERVKENLQYARLHTANVSIFSLINKYNIDVKEWDLIFEFANSIGIENISVGILKLLGAAKHTDLPDISDVYELLKFLPDRASKLGLKLKIPYLGETRHRCASSGSSISVWPTGEVRSCAFDREMTLGNLLEEPLIDIWKRYAPKPFCEMCKNGGYLQDSPVS